MAEHVSRKPGDYPQLRDPNDPGKILRPRQMPVRISTVLAPNLFWVVPLNTRPDSNLNKILKLERKLAAMYAKNVHVGRLVDDLFEVGKLVAVRRSGRDPHWYRGRILRAVKREYIDVKRHHRRYAATDEPEPVCRTYISVSVLLLDHGRYWDVVHEVNIRELPEEMCEYPPPQAFVAAIPGIRPLALDINYELNMKALTEVIAPAWSTAAMELVKQEVYTSASRFGTFHHYFTGSNGIRFGQLEVFSPRGNCKPIRRLLEKRRLGICDESILVDDLQKGKLTKEERAQTRRARSRGIRSALSIVGGRDRSKSVSMSRAGSSASPLVKSALKGHHDDETASNASSCASHRSSVEDNSFEGAPSVCVPSTGPVKRVGTWTSLPPKERSRYSSVSTASSATSGGSVVALVKRGIKVREAIKMVSEGKTLGPDYSKLTVQQTWATLRAQTLEERAAKKPGAHVQDPKFLYPMKIPAGVDLGKLLERQLATIPSERVGPKKIRPGPHLARVVEELD